ncbi:MAG: hypothetical protein QOF58_1367 [Pseudonocardiales bacterium]|nr:hypothetical protein [Pseudonocardiales bacterium]
MSSHYEVVFSTFLRDDTPPAVLDELRYHLGVTEQRPHNLVIDYDFPVLRPDTDSYLPGGDHVALRRQLRGHHANGEHHAWGLHARLYWLDDQWAEIWWQVVSLLAPHVEDDGYAGHFREEYDERATSLIILGGAPHLSEP